MATTHIDFRKIDYDQLIDKPIIRTDAGVDTLTTAGVYDKGDGKRYIVSVDGQNITQVIEEKDGYQERASSDGGSTWGDWDTVDFAAADDIDAEDVNYDNTTSELQATNVQDAIDEIDTSIDDIKEDITEIKNIIEVTEMEEPSEENEGNIIQYKGETNANFTQGYFYKCVSDGQDPATYSWVRIDVQPAGAGDDHEFITQAAYNALTPAEKAAKVYMIKENGTPSTVLTAGAGIDITNNVISADMSTAVYDNTTSGATATNVQDAIDEVFQSVSNGKTLIAAAITDKGVSTAASDSFQTMADNIESLDTGGMGKVISVQNPSLPRGTKIFSQVTYTDNYSSYSFSDYENYLEDANIYFFQVHREYNDSYYLGGTVMVIGSDGSIQTQIGERPKDWNSGAVFYTLPSDSNTLYIGSVKTGSSGGIGAQYHAIARYNLTTNVLSAGGEGRITYYNNGTRTNGEPVTFSGWTTKTVDITLTPENFSSNYSISEYHITNYYAN